MMRYSERAFGLAFPFLMLAFVLGSGHTFQAQWSSLWDLLDRESHLCNKSVHSADFQHSVCCHHVSKTSVQFFVFLAYRDTQHQDIASLPATSRSSTISCEDLTSSRQNVFTGPASLERSGKTGVVTLLRLIVYETDQRACNCLILTFVQIGRKGCRHQ